MTDCDDVYVYVIGKRLDDGWASPCKIGIARDPQARLRSFSTATPFRIDIFALFGPMPRKIGLFIERGVRAVHTSDRLHGEWFDFTPADAKAIVFSALWAGTTVHGGLTKEEAFHFAVAHTLEKRVAL